MNWMKEKLPSLLDINLIATFRYYLQVTWWKISGKITSKLPADALSSYFGTKKGWDNTDLRSRLLMGHFFRIQNSLKLWTTIPETYYVYRSNEARYELRELIKDHPYTVLVFIGIYPDHNKSFQSDFVSFTQQIPEKYNRYLVTNQYDISMYDHDDDVLWDYDAEVHQQLDIPLSMIYMVDTTGKVVWRSTWDQQDAALGFVNKLP
jgi:hypothetical protein